MRHWPNMRSASRGQAIFFGKRGREELQKSLTPRLPSPKARSMEYSSNRELLNRNDHFWWGASWTSSLQSPWRCRSSSRWASPTACTRCTSASFSSPTSNWATSRPLVGGQRTTPPSVLASQRRLRRLVILTAAWEMRHALLGRLPFCGRPIGAVLGCDTLRHLPPTGRCGLEKRVHKAGGGDLCVECIHAIILPCLTAEAIPDTMA
jgi:hypothetical protein